MLGELDAAIRRICPILGLVEPPEGPIEIQFAPEATDEQRSSAQYLMDNWTPPPPPRLIWALEFLDRFSEATQLRVVAAAQASPMIRLWYDRLLANGSVDLDNTRLREGLAAMEAAGVLTTEEITAALS